VENTYMKVIDWIEKELKPGDCTSEELFYDDMDSQSGYCLPIIYQPFDLGKQSHWGDRGALYDFLFASRGEGKRLLDFGPGDGWPSLIMAPFAREIIGVDGSRRRVDVCRANAERMGISNVEFVYVRPRSPLPFEPESFDGAMAASSIEQTADPEFAVAELRRVLKPRGRLRIVYEDLDRYRGGKEREATIMPVGGGTCKLVVYDRDLAGEQAVMYGITLSMPVEDATGFFSGEADPTLFERLTPALLEDLRPRITGVQVCTLRHPSGRTLVELLERAGFSEVLPTHSGKEFARRVFDGLPEADRPQDINALDKLLKPLIRIVVGMAAPVGDNPPITAVR
jgi:ubiquinone/menaquinone biosynthesis C-methylase UbiE